MSCVWSRRSAIPDTPSPWAEALQAARARGRPLLDLSLSNPTEAGLVHPEAVYRSLGTARAARYEPAPLGLRSARAAVARYYARRGRDVDPDDVWLSASTSEAYHHLLCMLCDPGDGVLVPRPGYPLLEHLATLAAVRRIEYPLRLLGRWALDVDGLTRAAGSARAIVTVSPDNPTGKITTPEDWQTFGALGLPVVLDEVFADYPLDHEGPLSRAVPRLGAPTFTLNGLSKIAALPQLKLSWVVFEAPAREREALRARAELVADTFLSVSTPVQLALPELLEAAEAMQPRIQERLRANLQALDRALAGAPVERAWAGGGWSVLLRLPALPGLDDHAWAVDLLAAADAIVQPGYLFDLDGPPRVSVSLLPEPAVFEEGITRLLARVQERCAEG